MQPMSDDITERLLTAKGSVRHGPMDDGSYSLGLLNNVDLCHEAADEIDHLRAGIAQAVEELGDHRQDPATEGMKRGMCVLCGAADGQWPCVTAMVRADLTRLLTEEP